MEYLKKGMEVYIIPNTRFWGGELSSNPKNTIGIITNVNPATDYCYSVKWLNNESNVYSIEDLAKYDGSFTDIYKDVNFNKIYFKDKKPKNLKDVLNILYSGLYDGSITTYNKMDKEYLIQCSQSKMRSFDDYLLICKTYFPNVKIETAFKNLLLFRMKLSNLKNNKSGLILRSCSGINRINISSSTTDLNNYYRSALQQSKYSSLYSWEELFKMININSFDDLIQFYKNNLKE